MKGSDEFQDRGSVQWLEEGDASRGLEHINQRHVTEDQFLAIEGIDTLDDVTNSIYVTIKSGKSQRIPSSDGGGTAYVHRYTLNDEITVIVGDNGYVVTARPGAYP
ncbi:hypothetical protein [Natronosalvus halobius]|uniref:hypothetical protein n=1 Tax=Natronosalvus halobius TaxID=2953746 RepID=UPI00209F1927|nr:hypothetical protein [Natronosalvus halobius]USZ71099.1 hypothetical protein NGM15_13535 [Natronosalvus halobius]